jgi:sec-independent protein translocase protein TatC
MDEQRMQEVNWADILHEGRRRVKRLLILAAVGFVVFWFLSDLIVQRIKEDLLPEEAILIVTSPMEYVMVKIQISVVLGVLTALPFFAYMLVKRLELKVRKLRLFLWATAGTILFAIGLTFTYFILLPVAMQILTSLSVEAGLSAYFSINQFIFFAFITTLLFSLVFELPLVVTWMAVNGLVSVETLKERRRHTYVAVFIMTAIITADPTPVSQILLAVPLIVLYELSILAARVMTKT